MINLIGSLGPELAFDALWYHLTLPKLYIIYHAIRYIPGGLLYYSVMPKLGEMLYIGGLVISDETMPKLIQFISGILVLITVYVIANKYFSRRVAVLCAIVFYANLVVAWESTTAYVDLIRTFFEVLAFQSFLLYFEKQNQKWLVITGMMIGCAITTKLIAIGTLAIFITLIFFIGFNTRKKFSLLLKESGILSCVSLLIPLPWFIFSYAHTGNPFYPLFTSQYPIKDYHINFLQNTWLLLTRANDPVSPVYILVLPLLLVYLVKSKMRTSSAISSDSRSVILLFPLLAIIVWNIIPQTGGGRFILPYLPMFSITVGYIIFLTKDKFISSMLILVILFISLTTILYRGAANVKFLPVIFGKESSSKFLTDHLNFSFGDFYDTDNFFKNTIRSSDVVLLYGFHNLYYANFPFIDSSWAKTGDRYDYICVQNGNLPKKYQHMKLVYENTKTHVQLYTGVNKQWMEF